MPLPVAHVELMRQGEAFFIGRLQAFDDASLAEPSGLPAWSRGHVVAHMARNADALGNLFAWARTGVESPMYGSVADRAEGIERTVAHEPSVLRADLVAASARLLDAAATLPAAAWDAPARTARGRAITGADIPWMRIRESWVHGVDLVGDGSFTDVPPEVVAALVDEVATGLAGLDGCPTLVLVDAECTRSWSLGPPGDAVEVSGPLDDVLGWLIGRTDGSSLRATTADGRPPAPPAWL